MRRLPATRWVRRSSSVPLGLDVKVDIDDEVSSRSMWETGEWTDDTSMAIAIAEVATTGGHGQGRPVARDPRDDEAWYFEEREGVEWLGRHSGGAKATMTPS